MLLGQQKGKADMVEKLRPQFADRPDWLSLPQIFFCRSKAHSAIPNVFGTKLTLQVQTVAAVHATFAKNENEKSLMSLKPTRSIYISGLRVTS